MPGNTTLTPAQMMTVPQVCENTGLSPSGVRKLITQGKLPAMRLGSTYRIDPADVAALLQPVTPDNDTAEAAAR